jgi:23S rRNA (cytidine1920-2'-O)/16S rRNA (cytidine1409-2'-O)-methyltransferase
VYAVDVGHGQLDARLRSDPRVVVREKVNARALSAAEVGERVDLVVADVSFISLRLILPAAAALAKPGAGIVTLVKPQFEAGRGEVPRGGVVKSEEVRQRVVGEIEEAGRRLGLAVLGSIRSPIQGARGNEEFLLGFRVN